MMGTNAGHVHDLVNGSWIQVGEDIDGEAADDESGNFCIHELRWVKVGHRRSSKLGTVLMQVTCGSMIL